jgi:hypothetical protein
MIVGKNVFNVYGATIVTVTSLKVAVYKGKSIFNFTTAKFEDATDISVGALPADNLVSTTAIPNSTNKIGYEIDLTGLPVGFFDVVTMDALVFSEAFRIHKAADGQITVVPE